MSERSGPKWTDAFAHYDPGTSSWRTSQLSLPLENSNESATPWPRAGIASRGAAYPLPPLARRIFARGSSSPPLLKTPTAQLAVNGGSQHPTKRKAGGHGPTLADEVEFLLPTPTATAYGYNQSPSSSAEVRPSLNSLAPTLLPTPTTSNAYGNQYNNQGKRLLPGIAIDLIGSATAPPFIDGKPSLDVPLPLQLWSVPAADES